ncbi:hypothetical protein [Bacillus sp. Marseille-P3661]|uniref:hypothetical protein n=1 Tax=Bacillus sp. Marseille-P3661 TaxID=1936234 RepID=UPI000C833936|nr:hypothetical protein [Bacillus sp. Marseille-P3661]
MKRIMTVILIFSLVIPLVTTASELNVTTSTPGFTSNILSDASFIETGNTYRGALSEDDPFLYKKDSNKDGIIDILDIVNLTKQYGKQVTFQPPKVEVLILADSAEYSPTTKKIDLVGAGIKVFDFNYSNHQFAIYRRYANIKQAHTEFVRIYEPSGAYMQSDLNEIGIGDGWGVTDRFTDVTFRQTGRHYVVLFIDGVPIKDMEIFVE